jgi:putative transcriptional regulator
VLHKPGGDWESTLAISDGIQVTTSRDILRAIADGKGPEPVLVALGYAGWDAGQLEREMGENSWLSTPADSAIIFETPSEQRLEAAAALMGVDINSLGNYSGHA